MGIVANQQPWHERSQIKQLPPQRAVLFAVSRGIGEASGFGLVSVAYRKRKKKEKKHILWQHRAYLYDSTTDQRQSSYIHVFG